MANASEWGKRVAAWRASGLTAEQFCAGREYSAKSLWHWSSRLGRAGDKGVAPRPGRRRSRTPEVVPVARLVRAGEASSLGSVVVELNGARIEVQGAVPATTLQAVFEALRDARSEGAR